MQSASPLIGAQPHFPGNVAGVYPTGLKPGPPPIIPADTDSAESHKGLPHCLRRAQIRKRIGNRVVVPELEQRPKLGLVQLIHPRAHIMRKHKSQEGLLFVVELAPDDDLGPFRAGFPG